MDEFLKPFVFGGLVEIATATFTSGKFVPSSISRQYFSGPPYADHNKPDVFFGPAMRKTAGGEKTDVLGTKALWVDVDDPNRPQSTIPCSALVFSGHGWHMYWFLKEPLLNVEAIEQTNRLLAKDVPNGDPACTNCNRILRLPNTLNTKLDPHVSVVLKSFDPSLVYSLSDFSILESLNKSARHRIRTGDSRGFRSRSERDWQILSELVAAGASDQLITLIFDKQPCGDKHVQNDSYLKHTLEKIRDKHPEVEQEAAGMETREDGYYALTKRGARRLSTFTIEPKLLLDGSAFEAEDAIVGDVKAANYVWKGKTFSRAAFTSVSKLDRETPVAAWQWLGRDDDLRALLPYLMEELRSNGLPKVAATPVMGLYDIDGKYLFVGDKQVLDGTAVWEGFTGPMTWLPSRKEHPETNLQPVISDEVLGIIRDYLPAINTPEVIWPIIGWYAASMLKPWLEANKYRFPILNVAGTKGSGKTTMIQRVFMPLFGQTDPKSYDANTTRFVVLALLGSSNAVPIAFSEFRYDSVEKFLRYVLLAYDTGHDPRGRSDQTTVDYPLSAPFSIDGEDLVEDPAARERIVAALPKQHTIAEGTTYYEAFKVIEKTCLEGFAGYYIQQVLEWVKSGLALTLLQQARTALLSAFPKRMPDRVRNNHVVAYFGVRLFCGVLGIPTPTADVMATSIGSVYDINSGRSKTLSDSMVEDIVNACSQGSSAFKYNYDRIAGVLYFQLASAHSWWLASRRRQGRGALERDAIRAQLKESPYIGEPKVIDDTWMYGIDLLKAQESTLDIPSELHIQEFTFRVA